MRQMINFDDFISQYRISMEAKRMRANPNPVNEYSTPEIEYYHCRLSRPGKEMDVFLSAQPSDRMLTLSDVLYMLAMDSSTCQMMEEYEESSREYTSFLAGLGENSREFEEFWQEYRWRCKQIEELRVFLGEKVYQKLMERLESNETLLQALFEPRSRALESRA